MKEINNILICGLGAIGGYYAAKIFESIYTLKVLVDEQRLKKYTEEPRIINNKPYIFDYILPAHNDYKADLIIIATKSDGLKSAIKNIKNFVSENTIILSFLNGISSEQEIINEYGDKVLYSYLLGHTFFRNGKSINHDGCATIHYGSKNGTNDLRIDIIKKFFDSVGVQYEIENDIIKSLWKKFCFNCCANQISALTRMTFEEMRSSKNCLDLIKNITDEITKIAQKEGIDGIDFYKTTIDSLHLMIPEGKTSMLQDIESGKKPETDIFGETVTKLGEKHNISTPYNKIITDVIKCIH